MKKKKKFNETAHQNYQYQWIIKIILTKIMPSSYIL